MIGQRIKSARLAYGWSLDQLAKEMAKQGCELTKASLSKYERGESSPNASVIRSLGQVLEVESAYFLSEQGVPICWVDYRKTSQLGKKEQSQLQATGEKWVEDFVWLEKSLLLRPELDFLKSERIKVTTPEEAEGAAFEVRRRLKIGLSPIESIVWLLESHGVIILGGYLQDNAPFDGLSGWVEQLRPVILANLNRSIDRTRYNIGHELGHLVIDCDELPEKDREEIAHRFSGAFIVPREVAFREIGRTRRNLTLAELGLLKRKYGLSIQAWIKRAFDLEIISTSLYRKLFTDLTIQGWRKAEPAKFAFQGSEEPLLLKQYVLRALNEGIIDAGRAQKICPGLVEPNDLPEIKPNSPQDLMRLSREERDRILETAAESALADYLTDPELTGFDAFEEDDACLYY